MRLLDARVDHLDENIGIISEFDHELLILLHHSETIFVHDVGVVEEQVIFRGQFNLDILEIIGLTLQDSEKKSKQKCIRGRINQNWQVFTKFKSGSFVYMMY